MKFSVKMLAMVSAVALLAACETAPNSGADADGKGGVGSTLSDGSTYLAPGVKDRVFFDYDSSVVNAEGQTVLQKQAEWLKKNSGITISIEGHCDERGTREYNLALGERRATATKAYLVNLGVASSRIKTISYGKERPAVVGSDEGAWAHNRRGVTVVAN